MPNIPTHSLVNTEGSKYIDVFVKRLLIDLNFGQNFAVYTHSDSANLSLKNTRQNIHSVTVDGTV